LKRIESDSVLAEKLRSMNSEAFLEEWYGQDFFGPFRASPDFSLHFRNRMKNNPEFLARSLEIAGSGRMPPLMEKLAYNRVPQLLIAGDLDVKFTSVAHAIAEKGNCFDIDIMKGCGHSPNLEKPAAVVERIVKYFRSGDAHV
jgi:pimeloyl-ACP methyl ester carboxylesterase